MTVDAEPRRDGAGMAFTVGEEDAQRAETESVHGITQRGAAGGDQAPGVGDGAESDSLDLPGAGHIQCTIGSGMPRRTAARRSAPATSAAVAPSRSVT